MKRTTCFHVYVDSESSERAGAGGMFQVIELVDGDERDFTHLIDTAAHYDEESLARFLNVPPGNLIFESL